MCIEHALRLLSDRTVYIIIYVTIAFWLAERSWLDSQLSKVHPNLFPGFLFFPFLGAEEREGNEVDLYQFAGQITLTISNMITISNLPLEDTKKELILLLERYPTNFVASHSKLWPFLRRPEWSEIKGFSCCPQFFHACSSKQVFPFFKVSLK